MERSAVEVGAESGRARVLIDLRGDREVFDREPERVDDDDLVGV